MDHGCDLLRCFDGEHLRRGSGLRPIGFLATFIFFNTFAINMFLQYKKVGPWKNYPFGEKAYIVLSLVAKSVLGWVIVLGTMGV